MTDHTPTPKLVTKHPEQITGCTYGTDQAPAFPLTLDDLARLIEKSKTTAGREEAAGGP